MNIHEQFESAVDLYVAGGLDPSERAEVEAHAKECTMCSAVVREAQDFATWARGTIAPDAPPADLEDRVIARFRASTAPKRRWWRFSFSEGLRNMVGIAAAAAFLVAVGGFFSPKGFGMNARGASQKAVRLELYDVKDLTYGLQAFPGVDISLIKASATDNVGVSKVEPPATTPSPGKSEPVLTESGNPLPDLVEKTKEVYLGARGRRDPFEQQSPDQKIIRSAKLNIEVTSYDEAYKAIVALTTAAKGLMTGAQTERGANGKIRATVTIRISPDRFDAAIEDLHKLGIVKNQAINTQDVTKAYIDLQTRLHSKEVLATRLEALLKEKPGTVKELMEVETQLSATNEQIEQIKGEIKYYDNLAALCTLTLELVEKDIEQPFEYVQSLQSTIALTVSDPDAAYAKAQSEITGAGGQLVDTKMTRQSDGSAQAVIQAKVDAAKFPAVREALKKLGQVDADTVNQQQIARGGSEGAPKPGAPVRREMAVISLTLNSPALLVTKRAEIVIETSEAEKAYQTARSIIESANGKIAEGSLTGHTDGSVGQLKAEADAAKFASMLEAMKQLGTVKNLTVQQIQPPAPVAGSPLLRERAQFALTVRTPAAVVSEERGLSATLRTSFNGVLWSLEMLVVGAAYAAPWIVALLIARAVYRRLRQRKAAAPSQG